MKHDVTIMGNKVKNEKTIQSYTKAERLDKEERERRKERTRVNHILTHDYYRNTKEKKYV
jgi:hypothetical protein|tara:strand:- start:252 stop:431 length:180 start_codon:yes stop_codon:yes gene_type:complete